MRAFVIVLGLVLMAVYIVHIEGLSVHQDSKTKFDDYELVRVKRGDPEPPVSTVTTAPALDGKEPKQEGGTSGSGGDAAEATKDSENSTSCRPLDSPFKTISLLVLPIAAAKMMM